MPQIFSTTFVAVRVDTIRSVYKGSTLKGCVACASRAFVYTNAIFALQNACWDSPKPFVYCIRWMQAAHLCQMLL